MTYRYERLTWQEARRAAEEGRVCILPVGSVEQHGPHLPMDVDMRIPTEIALAVGKANPDSVLVLPPICYGYTSHVMDFPGTINTNYGTFIEAVLDVIRSLAYHGFRRVVLLNGHGSNTPCLDIAARRGNLETTATCAFVSWWQLLTIDKAFLQQWRQSIFPGGCSHACELETSLYLHIDESAVRTGPHRGRSELDADGGFRGGSHVGGPVRRRRRVGHHLDQPALAGRRVRPGQAGDQGERRARLPGSVPATGAAGRPFEDDGAAAPNGAPRRRADAAAVEGAAAVASC